LKAQESRDRAYFLSDLHLGAYPRIEKSSVPMLMDFLDHIAEDEGHLFVVGDLLDFWFEYRTVVPRYPFRLLAHLRSMVDSGCQVTYIAGNHDYWMGNFLKDDVGVETHQDLLDTSINGKRFFISHGDGIATAGEIGYRVLKGLLRSRLVSSAFRLLHPDLGLILAKTVSRLSRKRSSKNNSDPNLESFVQEKAQSGFDYVVLGHLHKPRMFSVGNTSCLVIGDWIDNFTYGLFADGKLTLQKWNLNGFPRE
jgi:UDP-2,3-diacylglucosamine hydrolase